jgi:hypothetical protein
MAHEAGRGGRCCGICDRLIAGAQLADPATGDAFHAACVARRVPQDAVVALLAAIVLVLAPPVVVWAA